MDRKIDRNQYGFTLIELMIVIAIVGIVAAGIVASKNRAQSINSVNDDLHSIAIFLKRLRLDAFTQKVAINVTVAATQITTVIDPGGANTPGRSLNLKNNVLVAGSPFAISTRGNFVGGNIRIDYGVPNPPPTGTRYSCVVIDNIRVRLGEIDLGPDLVLGTGDDACDAI